MGWNLLLLSHSFTMFLMYLFNEVCRCFAAVLLSPSNCTLNFFGLIFTSAREDSYVSHLTMGPLCIMALFQVFPLESKKRTYTCILTRALCWRHCGGGGARRWSTKSAAWAVKFSNFAFLFQKFFSKELLLSTYVVGLCMLNNYLLRLSGLKF